MSSQSVCNILYVHYPSDLYGAGRSLLRLTERLDKTRFRPTILLQSDGPLKRKLEEQGVRVVVSPMLTVVERTTFSSWRGLLLPFLILISVLRIWMLIRKLDIRIVHTNTGIILSSGLAARLANVSHVWHIRDWFGEFAGLWNYYSRYMLWSSSRVVCVSKAIAEQFPSAPNVVVRNNGFALEEFAVDVPQLRAMFRQQHGIADGIVVGTVGRIKFVRKGQEVLVRAAAILRDRGINLTYIVVGSVFPGNEDHLRRLKDLVHELRVDHAVKLVGEIADPKPAYAAMDVFVLPSGQPEPFGGVVMEAMAMGVPVIGTNIGGTIDQVADGVTGFLIPPNDPAALADKIELLALDDDVRLRFSVAARERVRVKFSLSKMVEETEAMYTELVAERE